MVGCRGKSSGAKNVQFFTKNFGKNCQILSKFWPKIWRKPCLHLRGTALQNTVFGFVLKIVRRKAVLRLRSFGHERILMPPSPVSSGLCCEAC